jgi:3-hydroxybutyryl-CoA dehydratase
LTRENDNDTEDPYAPGRTVSLRYMFTVENIEAYATMAGDSNPLHHDRAFAKKSRFGTIIASAAHATGVLMSVVAEKFAKNGEAVGLGFSFTLRRAVKAGTDTDLIWRVSDKHWSEKLNGLVVELAGVVRERDGGLPLVMAEGRMLVLSPPRQTTKENAERPVTAPEGSKAR